MKKIILNYGEFTDIRIQGRLISEKSVRGNETFVTVNDVTESLTEKEISMRVFIDCYFWLYLQLCKDMYRGKEVHGMQNTDCYVLCTDWANILTRDDLSSVDASDKDERDNDVLQNECSLFLHKSTYASIFSASALRTNAN